MEVKKLQFFLLLQIYTKNNSTTSIVSVSVVEDPASSASFVCFSVYFLFILKLNLHYSLVDILFPKLDYTRKLFLVVSLDY